jgi:ABC-2 type transport system permease protein
MNLLVAEWQRFFARRVTVVMTIVVTAILAVMAMGFVVTSNQPTQPEIDRAKTDAAAAHQVWQQNRNECLDVERGVREPIRGRAYPKDCDYGDAPNTDQFLDYGFLFSREYKTLYSFLAVLLMLFGFVVGASYVGAEWTSGGMTNLLLWRPRRAQVLGTKLGAALTGAGGIAVAYLLVSIGVFVGVAITTGAIGTWTAGTVGSLIVVLLRAVALCLFGVVVGFTLASVGRHTSVALGVGIAYLIVYELGTIIFFGLLDADSAASQWRLSTYVGAFVYGKVQVDNSYNCTVADCVRSTLTIYWYHGAGVLAVVAAALVGLAFFSMRRRDVA